MEKPTPLELMALGAALGNQIWTRTIKPEWFSPQVEQVLRMIQSGESVDRFLRSLGVSPTGNPLSDLRQALRERYETREMEQLAKEVCLSVGERRKAAIEKLKRKAGET